MPTRFRAWTARRRLGGPAKAAAAAAILGVAVVMATAVGAPAAGSTPASPQSCQALAVSRLRCPDLVILRPYDVYLEHAAGRTLLHTASAIVNFGSGPAELDGRRDGGSTMSARQRIYRAGGGSILLAPRARLRFKHVPGYGDFWKLKHAARFELWSVDRRGRPSQRLRVGSKIFYCLRDLTYRGGVPNAPGHRIYPACSQDHGRRSVVLGTSPGWSDDYPTDYDAQFVNVTGLHGRFLLVLIADPDNVILESRENNNQASRAVRIP